MARTLTLLGAGLLFAAATGAPAQAQSVEEFYRGKNVNVLIGVSPGGEYDLQARLVARHIGKHIPGRPNVVPQNMTGAGGINMANYLAGIATRDGTYIGMMSNTLPSLQAVGGKGVRFDAAKFLWLGTIAPVVETMAVWHTSEVKSVADARKTAVVAGSTGRGSTTHVYPSMMNEFLDTKFKIVTGYQGGNLINLAMERGEVEARNNTWSSWKATRPAWLKEKKIIVIAQAGPRASDLDAPSVEELARTPDDRLAIQLVMSGTRLGRPLAIAPDAPADRVAALRAAFRATMKDPEFLAEAANAGFEVNPVFGEDMQRTVEQIMATPKEIAERVKHLVE